MTEFFSQPDDLGEPRASDLSSSLLESLGAQGSDAFMSGSRTIYRLGQYALAGGDMTPGLNAPDDPSPQDMDVMQQLKAGIPELPIADAQARIKQEGLDGRVKLPDQPTIKTPVLDLMIQHGHEEADRDAAIARGPHGLVSGALGLATSLGAGIIDPVNVAAFSIPVLGEARWGKMMLNAGDSLMARTGVRLAQGAVQGAAGGAALAPADWWLHTLDGSDYTFADALRSVVMSAGMGAGFHAGLGLYGDLKARLGGRPLPGTQEDLQARALSGDVTAAEALEGRGTPAEAAAPVAGEETSAPIEQGAPDIGESPENAPAASLEARSPSAEAEIHNDVAQRLTAAGLPAEEAEANGAVVAARYATRAQRLGMAPDEALDLYRSEGLQIHGPDDGLADDGSADRPPAREFAQAAGAGGDLFAAREADGQQSLPGTERVGQGEQAQRAADAPLKPKVNQKPMDVGLFGDESQQADLLDRIKGRSYDQASGAPVYYSAVERAIDASKQEKAPARQWLGMLRNATGVKADEMQWLGLDDWLKEQKGPVTKQAIADYVRANQIKVQEIEKGGVRPTNWTVTSAGGPAWQDLGPQRFATRALAQEELERRGAEVPRGYHSLSELPSAGSRAKFESYQLPGGENYRELLLTLPETRDTAALRAKDARYRALDDQFVAWAKREAPELTPAERDEREQLQEELSRAQSGADTFRGSHWDEPNVLAHVRFNDRTIDGKKTLFLEEIQSDWHQQGKRRGYREAYRPDELTEVAADDPHYRPQPTDNFIYVRAPDNVFQIAKSDRAGRKVESFADAKKYVLENKTKGGGDVPDAPFKTTWPELALKRMVRYAAEKGYDRVAWTPGDVQAARYDLSKQIKTVRFEKAGYSGFTPADEVDARKSGRLVAIDHDGRKVIDKYLDDQAQLADHVGKDVAEKLLAQKPQHGVVGGMSQVSRELSGLDLKVGGEGMSGFYDKILPAAANKLGKKFGAKVEQAAVDTGRAANEKWEIVDATDDGGGEVLGTYTSEAQAEAAARDEHDNSGIEIREAPAGDQAVHSLELTPELRKAALEEGFPLFQSGEGEPRGRITLTDNHAIVQLFKDANASTFMHEAGHLWLDELTRDVARPDAPEALKQDMATVLDWLGVKTAEDIGTPQHEQWARGFEQYLADGKAPSSALAEAFAKFKRWLAAIYQNLADLGAPVSDDVRAVMGRLLATDEQISAAGLHHPAETLADLPPRAQEDVVRAAVANVIAGRPVNVAEMLQEAAKEDPRIAESVQPDDGPITTIHMGPKAARGPRAKDPEHYSLLEFLAHAGGLKPNGELTTIFGGKPKFVPGFGPLLRKGGMTLDHARESAVEGGYIFDNGDVSGGQSESSINQLLELIDQEERGKKAYRYDREPPETKAGAKRREAERADEAERHYGGIFADALDEAGIDRSSVPDKTYERVVEIMDKEHVTDPLVAYEQAVMEETHYGTDVGQGGRTEEFIPGWDVPADAGAAPGGSGPAAAVGPDVARGPARQPGAGDRGADWGRLAADRAGDDDPALVAESKSASAAPEPASIDPAKAPKAAEQAAKDAEELLNDMLPKLSDDERAAFEDALNKLDQDRDAQERLVRDGAACLAEAAAA